MQISKSEATLRRAAQWLDRTRSSLRASLTLALVSWSAIASGQGVTTSISSSSPPGALQRAGEPVRTDVRASSFQQVTPGKTSLADLIAAQGDPLEEEHDGSDAILTYQLGPFPRVEVIVTGDIVDSVVVHLATPARPAAIAKELGLTSFTPALIFGEDGESLGQVYPERAVAFSFAENTAPSKVTQLVLEPISAEFFLLRAKNNAHRYYSDSIADLNYVLQADARNETAHFLKAQIYSSAGHYRSALKSIEAALERNPEDVAYEVLRARIKFQLGQYRAAYHETKSILDQKQPAAIRARAEALMGDLLANGPDRDFQTAMQHHLAAVKLLAPLAANRQILVRRDAKQRLVEVHLAIANDITHGKWSGKEESAPKWLRIAKELTDQLIDEDGGDETVRLLLLQQAIASYAGMRGLVDPTEVVEQSMKLGNRLISQSDDPLRTRELRWLLVGALLEAVRIEQMRGGSERVVEYAVKMDTIMKELEATEETSVRTDVARGLAYFLVGSTFAIQLEDHASAVRWYERALPFLTKARPAAASPDLVRHGQRFISMGVSYWEQNARSEAVRLTESGLKIMQSAIDRGDLDPAPLAVPYSNLSAMYNDLGRGDEANQLAAKAARIEGRPQPQSR